MAEKKEIKVPEKFQKLVSEIEKMSVLDLSELVKILEEKFGVSVPELMVRLLRVASLLGASCDATANAIESPAPIAKVPVKVLIFKGEILPGQN